VTDSEAPTPRLTGTWQVFATGARELADALRARELELGRVGASLDTRAANRARQYRMILESYAAAFARWTTEDVPLEQKARERDEFVALAAVVRRVLGDRP
jgi:hypothetical protein